MIIMCNLLPYTQTGYICFKSCRIDFDRINFKLLHVNGSTPILFWPIDFTMKMYHREMNYGNVAKTDMHHSKDQMINFAIYHKTTRYHSYIKNRWLWQRALNWPITVKRFNRMFNRLKLHSHFNSMRSGSCSTRHCSNSLRVWGHHFPLILQHMKSTHNKQ